MPHTKKRTDRQADSETVRQTDKDNSKRQRQRRLEKPIQFLSSWNAANVATEPKSAKLPVLPSTSCFPSPSPSPYLSLSLCHFLLRPWLPALCSCPRKGSMQFSSVNIMLNWDNLLPDTWLQHVRAQTKRERGIEGEQGRQTDRFACKFVHVL